MKPRILSATRLSFPLATAIAALIAISSAQAQTFTWDGGGGDANFGTGDNWSTNVAPSTGSGVILEFTGGTNTSPVNNYTTGDNFGEWWLLAGASSPFTITGSGFGLFNKIENSSSQLFTINTAGIYARDSNIEINPVGGNITIGSATTIELDGNSTLNVYDGGFGRTLTINGTLSNGNGTGGNGQIILNQTATVILTGTNDYGGTTLNAGTTLRIGDGGTTGTLGVGNVASSGSLFFNRSNDLTVTNLISGTGSVTKQGAGVLTLNNASNSYSGQLTVANGTLAIAAINNVSSNGNLGNSALAVILGSTGGNTGTLRYTGNTATSTKPISIASGGAGAIDVTTSAQTLTLSGAFNSSGNFTKLGAGALTLSGAATLNTSQTWTNNTANAISFGANLSLGANTLTFAGTGNFTWTTGSFGNAGTGNIIMNGSGVLNTRAATNTNYTGSTTITNGGTVLLNAAGKSTGNFNLNGGMVTDYFQQAGTFTSGLGTGINQIQIHGDSGFGAGNGGSTWTIGTALSSLQWGSTNFDPTTLKLLTSADNMGPTIFGQVTLANGLDLNGAARTISVLAATGTDAINSSIATISGNITSATGSITKTGGGNLRLTGTNSYGGGTAINDGMVRFASKTAMPASGAVAVSSGATLGILVSNGGTGWGGGTGNGGIAGLVNSGLGGQSGGTVSFAGNSRLFLDVTANTVETNALGNGGATSLSLIKYGTSTLTLSGNNTFSGSVAVGAGTLVLSGTNTYAGGTSITAGTAQFGKLTSMPATGTVAVSASTLVVNLGGAGEWTTGTSGNGTLGGLIAASAVGGQGNTVTWAGASAVGLDTTNAPGTQTYGTAIVNRGTSLGVTKLGAGTLTLSGTNTYTGTTTVNAGTLNMSGTFGNHPITVNGGLLNFTSSSGGNGLVTIAGGTFLYAGTKTAGSVSQTGGTLQLGTATSSGLGQITITGTISSNGTTPRTFTPRFVMNGPITLGDPMNNGKLTFTDAGGTSTTGSAARVLTVLSDAEFTTALGGTGGITKNGSATLTLSGASSNYSSTTIVNNGLFALGNGGNLTGATVVTVNAGTFGIRQNASATTNSVGSTASTFTLATGSALSMADGFYSTLDLLGSGAKSLAPATGTAPVLTFDIIGANRDLLIISGVATAGAATARIAISPTSTPNAGSSYTVITGGGGSALSTNFSLANNLLPTASGLMSLSLSTSTATAATVSVTNDTNALYWSGASSVDWNTAGNWNTSIAGGVVSGSAPVSTTNVAFSTTTPVATNLSNSLSAPLTVNSINFLPGTGAVTIGGSSLITVSTNINDNSATNQTINAPLAVTGNLNKTGAGILALAGSNTISGTVNLNVGTLQLANANAITSTSGITSSTTSAVNVTSGTTIQLRANANTSFNTGLITLPGGTVNIDVANNGSGTGNTLTLGTAVVPLAGGASPAITTVSASNTTLNITGSNGYGLILGRLQQPSGAGGSSFIVNASAPVTITQFQTGSFGSNFIAGSGTITLGVTGIPGFTQGANGSNSVTVNNGATLIMATAVGSYNSRSGGNYSTVLNSGGTLFLNNALSLANTGGVAAPTFTINGGTLDSTQSGGIVITAGTTTSPTQTWNGDFTFTGSQNLNLGNGAVAMVGTRQVTVSANTLTIGGAISGAGLTKAGAGTLVLGGANGYTGATAVNDGKLLINGNQSTATGAVSVAALATLGGNGTVGGATTFTGASIHAPGSAAATVGTQTFSSTVTYGTGTIFDWDLNTLAGGDVTDPGVVADASTGTYDQVTATGAITATGSDAVFKIVLAAGDSFADAFWDTNKSWTNIFAGGSGSATNLAAMFSSFSATGGLDSTGLVTGQGQFTLSNVSNTLSWAAVPEPTSALVGLLIGAGLLRRRRSA